MDSENDEVKRRAYLIWEEEGRPWGLEQEHWERARQEVAALAAAKPPIRVAEPRKPSKSASGNGAGAKLTSVKAAGKTSRGGSTGSDRKSP